MMTSGATTVLVVDDSSVICEVIRTVLEPVGYCVLSATDSFEALEACRRYPAPIDLLLTDVIMPGMDGRELASSVEGLRPSTRVLFMSGEVPAGDLQPSKPFLAKPWGPVDLLRKVEQTLSS
jgi:two-component system cell cycle sensor histidine kinase/response regulator CckA